MITTSFKELEVWEKAHRFTIDIYKATKQFPKHEMFGLVQQLRRSAVSIPGNIAEGYRKNSKPDKIRYFGKGLDGCRKCNPLKRTAQRDQPFNCCHQVCAALAAGNRMDFIQDRPVPGRC